MRNFFHRPLSGTFLTFCIFAQTQANRRGFLSLDWTADRVQTADKSPPTKTGGQARGADTTWRTRQVGRSALVRSHLDENAAISESARSDRRGVNRHTSCLSGDSGRDPSKSALSEDGNYVALGCDASTLTARTWRHTCFG